MSLGTLLHKNLGVALDAPVLQALSIGYGEQRPAGVAGPAHQVLQRHFTLKSVDLAEVLSDSFIYGLGAIDNELNGGYLGQALSARLPRSYHLRIPNYILEPFAVTHALDIADRQALCQQLHRYSVSLLYACERLFPATELPDPDIAELLASEANGLSQQLLERIEQVYSPLSEGLYGLLTYRDLLGDAVVYFFREILMRDPHVQATHHALQRVGLRPTARQLDNRLIKLQQQQNRLQNALTEVVLTRDRARRNTLIEQLDQLDDLLANVWAHQSRLQTFQQQFADWQGYLSVAPNELQQVVVKTVLPIDDFTESRFSTRSAMGLTRPEKPVATVSQPQVQQTRYDVPFVHGWNVQQVEQHQQQIAAALGRSVAFQDLFPDGRTAPELIVIPPGEFLMGSPDVEVRRADNERQHAVSLSQPFAIGKYPVTFAEYDRFCIATGRDQPGSSGWGRGRRPVINVSWYDAMAYCQWLSRMTGEAYRLPSEAEWEYACRAGTTTHYHFGDTITRDQANFQPEDVDFSDWIKDAKTTPVDQFAANPWGLYDCHGNVFEWTGSEYDKHYTGAEQQLLAADAPDDLRRVVRGGSWYFYSWWVHSSARFWLLPDSRNFLQGFRLARSL